MQIEVKELVWLQLTTAKVSGVYRVNANTYGQSQPSWSWGSTIMGHGDTEDEVTAAANAHHAAHVRSQVAWVRLTNYEALTLVEAALEAEEFDEGDPTDAVQAAIAAMGVGE